jgi:hypothetical protein
MQAACSWLGAKSQQPLAFEERSVECGSRWGERERGSKKKMRAFDRVDGRPKEFRTVLQLSCSDRAGPSLPLVRLSFARGRARCDSSVAILGNGVRPIDPVGRLATLAFSLRRPTESSPLGAKMGSSRAKNQQSSRAAGRQSSRENSTEAWM